jgi:hypothetical protein
LNELNQAEQPSCLARFGPFATLHYDLFVVDLFVMDLLIMDLFVVDVFVVDLLIVDLADLKIKLAKKNPASTRSQSP